MWPAAAMTSISTVIMKASKPPVPSAQRTTQTTRPAIRVSRTPMRARTLAAERFGERRDQLTDRGRGRLPGVGGLGGGAHEA